MTPTRELLATLSTIAQAAGSEIMDVYAGGIESWRKDDDSPLTAADLRADAVIRKSLEAAFPGVFILSEESASAAAQPPECFFLVDPLDGTKEFLKRNGEFTVNIALVEDGVATAGVVYAPALDELYFGAIGIGCWKQAAGRTRELKAVAADPAQPLRVIGSRSHGGDALQAWVEQLGRPVDFVAAGSSLKFCRVAEGAADLYPRLAPTCQWDTAAAQAVLEAAGGQVLDPDGRPLRYGLERPMLNPHFVALGGVRIALPPLA